MKRFTNAIAVVMAMLLMVMSFAACGAKSEIKEVITTYQNAGIELDLERAQTCLDPECEQYAALAEGLQGGLTESLAQMGLEETELKSLLREYGKLVETNIKNVKADKETATAICCSS